MIPYYGIGICYSRDIFHQLSLFYTLGFGFFHFSNLLAKRKFGILSAIASLNSFYIKNFGTLFILSNAWPLYIIKTNNRVIDNEVDSIIEDIDAESGDYKLSANFFTEELKGLIKFQADEQFSRAIYLGESADKQYKNRNSEIGKKSVEMTKIVEQKSLELDDNKILELEDSQLDKINQILKQRDFYL